MFNPDAYPDDAVLTTAEVALWTGWAPKTVLSLGLPYLAHLKKRHRHYRAGDVKTAILGDRRERAAPRHLKALAGGGGR